jgi:hypothetical protein
MFYFVSLGNAIEWLVQGMTTLLVLLASHRIGSTTPQYGEMVKIKQMCTTVNEMLAMLLVILRPLLTNLAFRMSLIVTSVSIGDSCLCQ